MGDARLYRMKGRKLGEIVLYASMIALEPDRRNKLVALIGRINDDINDIDVLLSGVGTTYHDRISDERYLARLNDLEIDDENYLNELRSVKESVPECAVIEDAAPSEPAEPVVEADVPCEETSVVVEMDVPEEISDVPDIDVSEEVPDEYESDADPYMQPLFTEDDEKMLNDIKVMKDGKIDLFIERELVGNFKEEACEDVIRFTKIDIKLIDLLLKLDYSDRAKLQSDLKELVDIVNNMDAPKFGKLYINSLTKDEAKLEARYNEFIDRVDELVRSRFPEIVPQPA